jgi:hypothetical protein
LKCEGTWIGEGGDQILDKRLRNVGSEICIRLIVGCKEIKGKGKSLPVNRPWKPIGL